MPTPPTIVDETTAREPCRPGAWGDETSCAAHEGQPLDEHGLCFWGRRPGPGERLLSASLLETAAAAQRRRLGGDERSDLLDVATLRRAKLPALLVLAFKLNVPIPKRRRGTRTGSYSPQERARLAAEEGKEDLANALAQAIHADRAKNNPVIAEIDGHLRTVE